MSEEMTLESFDMELDSSEPKSSGTTSYERKPFKEGVYWGFIQAVTQPKKDKNGNWRWGISVECSEDQMHKGEHEKKRIWGNVTAWPKEAKAAWTLKAFLKTIGQPYKDKFKLEPAKWVGVKVGFRSKVFEGKDEIKAWLSVEDYKAALTPPKNSLIDDVPF